MEWRADAEGGFFGFATAAEVERGAAGFLAACAVDAAWPAGRAAGCLAADFAGAVLAALRAGCFGAATAFFATFFTVFFGAEARFGVFAGAAAFFLDAVGRVVFLAAGFLATVFLVTVFFAATFPAADFFTTALFATFFFGATFAADLAGAALRAAARAGARTAFFAVFAGLAALAAVVAFFTLEPLPAAVLPLVALACWVVRVDFAISISRCDLAAGCYSL